MIPQHRQITHMHSLLIRTIHEQSLSCACFKRRTVLQRQPKPNDTVFSFSMT